MVSAIVLAAGTSARMGSANKLLLPYAGSTVVQHIIAQLLAAQMQQIIVVTGHEATAVTAALQPLPVQVIHNPCYAQGITTSIQKGVAHAGGNGYMICLADMVTITAEEYRHMAAFFTRTYTTDVRCICIPVHNKRRGNPVIFSSFFQSAILAHTHMDGCKQIVQSHAGNVHELNMPLPHVLTDMDAPDDYSRLMNK